MEDKDTKLGPGARILVHKIRQSRARKASCYEFDLFRFLGLFCCFCGLLIYSVTQTWKGSGCEFANGTRKRPIWLNSDQTACSANERSGVLSTNIFRLDFTRRFYKLLDKQTLS